MPTEFHLIIHRLETAPSIGGMSNVVRKIAWELQARNGIAFAREQGICELADPATAVFVEYDLVNEQKVTQWLWENVNKNDVEKKLDSQIQSILNPSLVVLPLPWQQKFTQE